MTTNEKEALLARMREQSTLPITDHSDAVFKQYRDLIDPCNSDDLSQLLYYEGIYYFRIGNFSQALNALAHCLHAPKNSSLQYLDASAHNVIGLIHSYLSQEVIARDEFMASIRICQKNKLYEELAIAYSNLGFLYSSLGSYKEALRYCKEAETLLTDRSCFKFHLLLTCLAYQGICYAKSAQYAKCIELFQEIEHLQTEENDVFFDASMMDLGIRVSMIQHDKASFLSNLQKLLLSVSSKEDFLKSSEFYFDICDLFLENNMKNETRQILDHMKKFADALPLFFLPYHILEYEVRYAKKFCSDADYLSAAADLLKLFPAYENEQREAQNYSLEYIEHIHQTRYASNQLEEKSKLDPMTNLLNKYTIQFLIEEYLAQNKEENTAAAILVDMDHFKQINDTMGHLTGDAIISKTASIIQQYFKDDAFCGRIGGDEFLIFIKDVTDPSSIILQAELLREKIHGQITERNLSITTQASIGISFSSVKYNDYQSLFTAADTALYQAKNNGRNKVVVIE